MQGPWADDPQLCVQRVPWRVFTVGRRAWSLISPLFCASPQRAKADVMVLALMGSPGWEQEALGRAVSVGRLPLEVLNKAVKMPERDHKKASVP